jgi:hypothetical protein
MANETDKQLNQAAERSFDAAAIALNELAAEIVTIEQKYGSASSLLKKKLDQLQTFKNLYTHSLTYINYLRDLNDRMFNEVMARELERHRKETGLSYEQLGQLIGGDAERWKKIDQVDAVLRDAKTRLGITDDSDSFESFIKTLRGDK